MIHYTKTVRTLLLIGASLTTLKGADSSVCPIEPINLYSLAAAQVYVQNNMPSKYSSYVAKTARACQIATTQPLLFSLTFFGWDSIERTEELRKNYCKQQRARLLLGGLPVAQRDDRLQILQAFDKHTEQAMLDYWKYDLVAKPSDTVVTRLVQLGTFGLASASFFLSSGCLSWIAPPCGAVAAASCCLARCVAVTDRL